MVISTSARVNAYLQRQNLPDMREKISAKENLVLILKASAIEKILKKDLHFGVLKMLR